MKTMNATTRVITAINFQEPDRVPITYLGNPGITQRLKRHYGISDDNDKGLFNALGVDIRNCWPHYNGPTLFEAVPERNVNEWGIRTRWIEHEFGGYWDYCDFPLKDATSEQYAEWPMPDPDNFDYSQMVDICDSDPDRCWVLGSPGVGDMMNSCGMLCGQEDVLYNLADEHEGFLRYCDRRISVMCGIVERALHHLGNRISLLWMGEDLGTQKGPIISIDMYRRLLRPRHQRIIDIAKAHDIPVMIHSCGSSSWAFEDFIDMGINVVDTLQPEAKDMSPEYLKSRFGGRLAFHGCISTAGPVADGTTEQTIADCREKLKILMPGGGYCFAPTHQLQDNSPTENVIAMYNTAKDAGRYCVQ